MRAAWKAAALFRGNPHLRGYAFGKCLLDPVYPFLARKLLTSGLPLLDIGCGAGVLAALLRVSGHRAAITGIDPDREKIAVANRVFGGLGCEFHVGDAEALPQHSGDVVMLDVIHYVAPEERQMVIADIGSRLAPGGTLYLRTTLRDESLRYRITRLEEWFVRASGWIPFVSAPFPSFSEIEEAADRAGLAIDCRPMWGRTPFNSHLLTMRKGIATFSPRTSAS
ncbi:MAG: class I SAM-dependent methyltransferase [Terrimicrobiaceae bacterium]